MLYLEITEAERCRIAAGWVIAFTLVGLAIGHLTGIYTPLRGAVSWGVGSLIGGAIAILWARHKAKGAGENG